MAALAQHLVFTRDADNLGKTNAAALRTAMQRKHAATVRALLFDVTDGAAKQEQRAPVRESGNRCPSVLRIAAVWHVGRGHPPQKR